MSLDRCSIGLPPRVHLLAKVVKFRLLSLEGEQGEQIQIADIASAVSSACQQSSADTAKAIEAAMTSQNAVFCRACSS